MNYTAFNLKASGREYTAGIACSIIGGCGLALAANTEGRSPRSTYFIAGGMVSIVGAVFLITSRYSIAKAGKWRFTPNSVVLDF